MLLRMQHLHGNRHVQRVLALQESPLPERARDQAPKEEDAEALLANERAPDEDGKEEDVDIVQLARDRTGAHDEEVDSASRTKEPASKCPACADKAIQRQDAGVPPPPVYTYAFISRGSYGQTTAGFTRPSCVPTPPTGSNIAAGSANPVVTVFPSGTYQVRRNDGVVKTATCTRLAAGLAATRVHENSHAAGARAAVTAANTAQGLPQSFATAALCSAALPPVLTAWNTSVNAAWNNQINHGAGTNPPTAQTFTQENAAGTCTFA